MSLAGVSKLQEIKYVFLDRDGVINQPPPEHGYVTSCDQLELSPGVAEAISQLNRSGRKVMVATNQRGVALGLFSQTDLDELHAQLQQLLESRGARLDAVYCCPHDGGQCGCRKPLPGLFEQAFRDFPGATAGNSIMIGDSLSDIEAGKSIGMRTIFICDGNRVDDESGRRASNLADATATSLLDAVERYFEMRREESSGEISG